jgi:hypothetical protein
VVEVEEVRGVVESFDMDLADDVRRIDVVVRVDAQLLRLIALVSLSSVIVGRHHSTRPSSGCQHSALWPSGVQRRDHSPC